MKAIFENRIYDYVKARPEELAKGIISLGYNEGGTFLTCVPISDHEYRKTHKTKAKVEFTKVKNIYVLEFTDDWGTIHDLMLLEDTSDDFWYIHAFLQEVNKLGL